jgi:hypothetical protein
MATAELLNDDVVDCVETSKVGVKGLTNPDACCRGMQKAGDCAFIGGVMDVFYNYDKKTGTYEGAFPATHICPGLPKAGGAGIYTNNETMNYCLAEGYTFIVS